MRLREPHIRSLLSVSRETRAVEIDCEEFLVLMPTYAEARLARIPLDEALEKAHAHEKVCANCSEELLALLEMVDTPTS
jgi:hypothetical protein